MLSALTSLNELKLVGRRREWERVSRREGKRESEEERETEKG